jgi:hypothetical protein
VDFARVLRKDFGDAITAELERWLDVASDGPCRQQLHIGLTCQKEFAQLTILDDLEGPVVFRDPFDKVCTGRESDLDAGTESGTTHRTLALVWTRWEYLTGFWPGRANRAQMEAERWPFLVLSSA